ncbi:glycosyltransferase family A protein [Balneolales bacterium ANBcel1]|nr:glycosyltransferase family A protein [Balneolales bacterium ANBcel1]
MKYLIITPAFNEAGNIAGFIRSVAAQTRKPVELVIVNDNSTDDTLAVAEEAAGGHSWIRVVNRRSRPEHITGSKVAEAFLYGIAQITDPLPDVIVKLDADLVLPPHYFETVLRQFEQNPKTGICGGVCAIRKGELLKPEILTDRFHVRGALKAYRRECYEQIGGIRPVYGWDTLDELLAACHGWDTVVLPDLCVEHRAPTGNRTRSLKLHMMTGELFYRLGYGPVISLLASAKRCTMHPFGISALISWIGYLWASLGRPSRYVDRSQAKCIRRLRYRRILKKITGSTPTHGST